MDYEIRQPDSQKFHLENEPADTPPTLETADARCLSRQQTALQTRQRDGETARRQTFLQRLPQSSQHFRLDGAAQHRFRPSGRADGVLHFEERV